MTSNREIQGLKQEKTYKYLGIEESEGKNINKLNKDRRRKTPGD
jgi:hypothetical protein